MTILLAERFELVDDVASRLRIWKVCHTLLYILTAVFGIANASLLFQIEDLVANRCIFYPKILEFHWVDLQNETSDVRDTDAGLERLDYTTAWRNGDNETESSPVAQLSVESDGNETNNVNTNDTRIVINKDGSITNLSLMMFADRSVFRPDTDSGCQFAEYMPLVSATFAIVWTTLFIMCPSGGRATRLRQPWRILTPALVFAVVMVILTGVSFSSTNSGLLAFCAAFHEHTNTTNCAPVNKYLERSWDSSFTIGHRISLVRAAAAGVLACWAITCAVLLARCITGPDFIMQRTAVHVVKDPAQKVTPYLVKKHKSRKSRSTNSSPNKRDNISVRSEPTNTTELVTVSVEQEDSQPTSLATTPLRERPGEGIEMAYSPKEYKETV